MFGKEKQSRRGVGMRKVLMLLLLTAIVFALSGCLVMRGPTLFQRLVSEAVSRIKAVYPQSELYLRVIWGGDGTPFNSAEEVQKWVFGFQFNLQGNSARSALIDFIDGVWSEPRLYDAFIRDCYDIPVPPLYMSYDLSDAISILKMLSEYKEPPTWVFFRRPVYPGLYEPYYIFPFHTPGETNTYILIGSITGAVDTVRDEGIEFPFGEDEWFEPAE
jgi:hypothetical protein